MIEIVAVALVVVVFLATVAAARSMRSRTSMLRALDRPSSAPPTSGADPSAPLVQFLRRHRGARRAISGVSVVLGLVAVGMLAYPFYTNLYQSRLQDRLNRQLASPELQQAYRSRSLGEGDALTRIRIPAIDVDVVVVEGTTASALRAGAGHYPQTPLPCERGNVAIAGHRTTYGKPFHNLDRLKTGDEIILETPIGTCTYKVDKGPFVVLPNDTSVVAATPAPQLTLTTCHPKGSASHRLVVQAALEGPAAAA
jgi:sortase A